MFTKKPPYLDKDGFFGIGQRRVKVGWRNFVDHFYFN
jgi:hypothetical protein